jgi:hypothetical protein
MIQEEQSYHKIFSYKRMLDILEKMNKTKTKTTLDLFILTCAYQKFFKN